MVRWALLLLSLVAFALAFQTRSPGVLGLSLAVAIFALVGSFLGFANARMQSQAQDQFSRETAIIALTQGKAAKERQQRAAAPPASRPASRPAPNPAPQPARRADADDDD